MIYVLTYMLIGVALYNILVYLKKTPHGSDWFTTKEDKELIFIVSCSWGLIVVLLLSTLLAIITVFMINLVFDGFDRLWN